MPVQFEYFKRGLAGIRGEATEFFGAVLGHVFKPVRFSNSAREAARLRAHFGREQVTYVASLGNAGLRIPRFENTPSK